MSAVTYAAAAAVFAALLVLVGKRLLQAARSKKAPDYESESFFAIPGGGKGRFPVITEPGSVTLSVIVPAYNEEKRIAVMMDEMLGVLRDMSKRLKGFTWEVLVVDDGSKKDNTYEYVMKKYCEPNGTDCFRVLKLYVNNGKGGAVRKGMVRARGQYLLMADADGATKAYETERLLEAIKKIEKDGHGVAIGSRAHLNEAAEGAGAAKRSPLRRFLMWGFHTYIGIMIGSSQIKDTQCGFKMFTRKSAAKLFPVQNIDRWAFDVELVFLAASAGIPMVEVPVTWEEVDGSKVDLMSDTLQMARDILTIRMCYMFGVWSKNAPAVPPAALPSPGVASSAPAPAAAAPAPAAAATEEPEGEVMPAAGAAEGKAVRARRRHA